MNEQELLEKLNKEQREAVLAAEGPVLILAGAGSGKTRVLVHRIAWMIDVLGVSPGSILAITFTNKAADEMRSRVDAMIGFGAEQIAVSTFHSFCVRILRRYAEPLGYTRYFSIYDTDDQLSLMKQIFHQKNIDPKKIRDKAVLHAISSAKDELVTPERYREINKGFFGAKTAELYTAYQQKLRENNAMDFDDLIMNTVRLFESNPDILEIMQERYRYLMVDEYQDTNTAQFRFVSLLAGKYRNLCVVGDDDQSIYKFRGANIRNILGFEKIFPDAKVVRLEQNYRSTQNILNAANSVIRNNRGRKDKKLWTENPAGDRVGFRRFSTGFEEAEYVADAIGRDVREKTFSYKDCAVLYRTNAQSRLFEEKFIYANIPYRIVGGINFYARKEIKDLIAYLKTIDNGQDDLACRRIINVPKRGIGNTTTDRIAEYAESGGISFFEAASEAEKIDGLSKAAAKKVKEFTAFINEFRNERAALTVSGLLKDVIGKTGYSSLLEAEETEEAESRLENISELISKAVQYEEKAANPTLSDFLEEVALIADIDDTDMSSDRVLLMTLHSAKGLEFPCVYMAGMEEGVFPGLQAVKSDSAEEIEEERRLAYVGITRAKQKLTLLYAKERMVRGEVVANPLSRFVREIPREYIDTGYEAPGKQRLELKGSFGKDMREAIQKKASPGGAYISFGGEEKKFAAGKYQNPYISAAAVEKRNSDEKTLPDYAAGDSVRHVKFGVGRVVEITDGGRDYFAVVDFPGWGVKRLCVRVARLEKV